MREDTQKSYQERLSRVLVFIATHLDRNLSLEELAGIACFSPFHFHRIFKGMTGESVAGHIRRLRLERAARQLKDSDRHVIDIAFDAGYESHEAFSRAFKGRCGLSPTEYRRGAYILYPTGVGITPQGVHVMKIRIEDVPSRTIAYMQHKGPYDTCGETWDKLLPILGEQGLLGAELIGVCHDDPEMIAPEEVRYDACVVVPSDFEPSNNLSVKTIPGGKHAVTTHQGPYNTLGTTYATFYGQWLPQSGFEVRDQPPFEIYLNDPEGTDPEDLLTDIYLPLRGESP